MHSIYAAYCDRCHTLRGLSVCMFVTLVYCAKTAEPIEMPLGADSCGPKEPLSDGVKIGRIHSQP